MRDKKPPVFGVWELAVLALLRERAMHPYQMQRLLRDRHKDELLVLKRGSLYHAIHRLLGAGLIKAVKVGRSGRRPERTTYRITREGEQELIRWLRQMLANPKRESSEFMACMSFLIHLEPDDAISQLEERAQQLEQQIREIRERMSVVVARVTRINMLESEYLVAMLDAERKWIQGLLRQLRLGELKWDLQQILAQISEAT
jgi:DNA-binding PadR family transcriptional regulator